MDWWTALSLTLVLTASKETTGFSSNFIFPFVSIALILNVEIGAYQEI